MIKRKGLKSSGKGEEKMSNFESQIMKIFGTTDLKELKQIAETARNCQDMSAKTLTRECRTGRKNSFTDRQLAQILALRKNGENITNIAKRYQVSRQTIYSQIRRAHHFSNDPDVKTRMYFMNRDDLCTTIDVDFLHERIYIQNYTDQIILRAFGVRIDPKWKDFEDFLEERCFPRTRDHAKEILREMELPFYDPLLIIEKTEGRMAGDHQWIMILKKEV